MKEAEYVKNRGILWCGKHYTARALAVSFDIDPHVFRRRLLRGMSVEQALIQPVRKRKAMTVRAHAVRAGLVKYEGTHCDKHNSCIRYVDNYRCVLCHAEDQDARRQAKRKHQAVP